MPWRILAIVFVFVIPATASSAGALECESWLQNHPEWIWCDDFEDNAALERSYFEVGRAGGRLSVSRDAAVGGSSSLKGGFSAGVESAGDVKLSFGRTPVSPQLQPTRDFIDVYWRIYVRVAPGWVGSGMKISRASVFSGSNWTQAAAGMVWEDHITSLGMGLDPVSGVSGGVVVTTKYNDFANYRWLGHKSARTQIYAPGNHGKWFCLETRMKLNTPGQRDGVFSFWVDGQLEAEATNLDWRSSYSQYSINSIFLENWINSGPTQAQARYMDNFVVSTGPIGCAPTSIRPNPPTNVSSQ